MVTNSWMMTIRRLALAGSALALITNGWGAPARAAVDPNDPNVVVRRITVPIQGSFSYSDDFGDARGTGTHQGNDLMVPKGRPLLAVTDGTVRRVFVDDGNASQGNMLVLRDSEGWDYWYIHINNDTPGTDDGLNPFEHAFAPGITLGASVKAGQVVAYAGDSGNAESTGSHLHFEIHPPAGAPAINPYPSLRLAQGLRFGNRCAFDTNPARTPAASSARGYWLLGADGGVFTFGDAGFFGSTGGIKLNRPAVSMAATRDGKGYWFAATDGGVFSFGSASFFGSTGGIRLNQPIVGMAVTPTGNGYWLVARDGGIFAFGDAGFVGSAGAAALSSPVTDLAVTPTGKGYWLLSEDGRIYAFGDATDQGSPAGTGLCDRPAARRLAASATGRGYWVVADDGSVSPFGDAADLGSPKSLGITPAGALLDLVTLAPPPPVPTTTTTTTRPPTTTTTRSRRG
jgi:hypothetical protein